MDETSLYDAVAETAIPLLAGRKLALWGTGEEMIAALGRHGLAPQCLLSDGEIDGELPEAVPLQEMQGKAGEYYVLVPARKRIHANLARLRELGFQEEQDCLFAWGHPPVVLASLEGEYSDRYGNRIYGACKKCRIQLNGYHSVIDFRGANITGTRLTAGNGCTFVLGKGTSFAGNICELLGQGSVVRVGQRANLGRATIRLLGPAPEFSVGDGTTAWHSLDVSVEWHSSLSIGKDCMLSSFVKIDTADGHSIFDVRTGENLNSGPGSICHHVAVGDHVWIGKDAFLLGNTDIGSGSIVGARSLVKGRFPNNCVIAGIPAKVVATDRAWSRKYGSDDIHSCGDDYIAPTAPLPEPTGEEDAAAIRD